MSMRSFLLLALCGLPALAVAAPRKPNIIVFFTDDHGFADLGCQGVFEDLKTPNIDALTKSGVRMTSGYVTAPQCVPSRAGLLTGMHQNRFGVESNGKPLDGFNRELTIAERLQKLGYATGMTGKWHLGPIEKIVDHGFDDVYAKSGQRAGWANFNLDGSDRDGGKDATGEYHLDANSQAACAFIRRHKDEPFFFYCAFRAPHVPLDAPEKYLKRFPGEMPERRRQALGMLSAVDDGIGSVVSTLRELNLEERTLIFLVGDNGAPLKIHKHDAPGGGPGWDGSLNDPLNGEKGMLSEGGIRVPFVVSWKGALPAGRVYEHPVTTLDVAATAAALAGAEHDERLDGENLIPALQSGEPVHNGPLYWRWISQAAIREGNWKYLRGGSREYLFDLAKDMEEKQNLSEKHPELVARLSKELQAWSEELQPPGIETQALSETWSAYFDFYLDGKPAPPLRARTGATGKTVRGWVVRNGQANEDDGVLRVKAATPGRKPFIAQAGFRFNPPVSVTLQLEAARPDRVGVAWREEGQKDFPSGQAASLPCREGKQRLVIPLNAKRDVIHLRVLLPSGGASIHSMVVEGRQGAKRSWDFGKRQ